MKAEAPYNSLKPHKGEFKHPKKRFYRQRAHCNPLNDHFFSVPTHPAAMDWVPHFPAMLQNTEGEASGSRNVQFADVGCGFGGLLIRLSTVFPDTLMVGMEIRDKVTNYVKERIGALRREHQGQYGNITAIRTNSQKYLVNFFAKGQLTKLFFLFPDPHFKAVNHRRRIIQPSLLAEYAYCLAPGGMLYTITDVEELGIWMRERLDEDPLFQRMSDEELESDAAAGLLTEATEEGQKVARCDGETFRSVYRRLPDPVEEV